MALPASVGTPLTIIGEYVGSAGKRVITHQGKDRYEVLWSTEVTQAKALRRSVIHEIRHIELARERIPEW